MGDNRYSISIFAPMSGRVVDLSEVPDPVYAERMMGDGVAIVPEDGTMFSPVDGIVSVVAEDKHAVGFTSDDGLEVLVHLGVDSKMQDDCCGVHVKVNQRVQAGDMIAEFDLEKLQARGVNLITPIIICGGLDGKKIEPAAGHILAGAGAVMTVIDVAAMERDKAKAAAEKPEQEEQALPVEPDEEESHQDDEHAADMAENDVMSFLHDKKNLIRLIGGFVALTALMVVIFVSIAMYIGH